MSVTVLKLWESPGTKTNASESAIFYHIRFCFPFFFPFCFENFWPLLVFSPWIPLRCKYRTPEKLLAVILSQPLLTWISSVHNKYYKWLGTLQGFVKVTMQRSAKKKIKVTFCLCATFLRTVLSMNVIRNIELLSSQFFKQYFKHGMNFHEKCRFICLYFK